jgi:hypothetical protein
MRQFISSLLVFFFLSLFSAAKAQKDSLGGKWNIHVFIKGHYMEQYIAHEVFTKGAELALSDTTYTIEKWQLCWDDTAGNINCVVGQGDRIVPANYKISFGTANKNSTVTLDNIRINKNGVSYKAAAQAFYLVPGEKTASIYDTLARSKVYLPGYENAFKIPKSIITNEFIIDLYDNSYKLLSFFVTIEFFNSDNSISFYFTGNKTNNAATGYKSAIEKLTVRDTIILENIFAEKDGKIYRVPNLILAAE